MQGQVDWRQKVFCAERDLVPSYSRGHKPLQPTTPNTRWLSKTGRFVRTTAAAAAGLEQQPQPQQKLQDATLQHLMQQQEVLQLYRSPGLSKSAATALLRKVSQRGIVDADEVSAELCFNVALESELSSVEAATLSWLLRETFEPELLTAQPSLAASDSCSLLVEVGPRMSFTTAWCANAVSICQACGLAKVLRIEVSRRFLLHSTSPLSDKQRIDFSAMVHDRMTEQIYPLPLRSFKTDVLPMPTFSVPLMTQGRAALEEMNSELGLAFDDWDLDYYTKLFTQDVKRDPTNVELFDIAQSNSEHSRHWFFRGKMILDGEAMPDTLMDIVKAPWKANPSNSVVGFNDNSSAIRGTEIEVLLPMTAGAPCPLLPQQRDWDILLTAETHNFPCAVAPFPGAETGAGGRIRDTHATGTGSIMGASTAGYCTGNLLMEDHPLPGEDVSSAYPPGLAPPLQILIDASNGASEYGNKFGEPMIAGYTRTFGQRLPSGERREWLKPIMFSGGLGQIDHGHLKKLDPEVGMLIVKIGGPAYRIGMGGGAASSIPSGSNKAELDFNAVQRGDAEMANKLWRVVRACVELGPNNPLQQIHDQGAGGNCNVVKEIIYPLGAEIDIRQVKVGDETLSVLEIWGAEYQENDCILIPQEKRELLQEVCLRERTFMQVIGSISGDGKIVLKDPQAKPDEPMPVDLHLDAVLGDMPPKTFTFNRQQPTLEPLRIPDGTQIMDALHHVLRLPAVGSKRFLTTKADRCVTGLVAQQQCCGPLQLPVADVGVTAQSHFGLTGAATSIGERPLMGLINPAAMARMALGESLTNLMWAAGTKLEHIKASVNWMYAAKMDGEGAAMYDAALALRDAMLDLRMACDGGKDSLSMAASAGGETVKAPGNLVISSYVTCPDITLTVTPDLKLPGQGRLLWVPLSPGHCRLGGSALAQAFSQVGDEVPDVSAAALEGAWEATQGLLRQRFISAGHDVGDGGIAVTLLEMAFAGNCGLQADLPGSDALATLFSEELGLVLEVDPQHEQAVLDAYSQAGLKPASIGSVAADSSISIAVSSQPAISGDVSELRDAWEATSFRLEREQCAAECVDAEQQGLASRQAPTWSLPYTPAWTPDNALQASNKPRIAVIREEGSNGDREMASAMWMSGLEPWDITMSDLLNGRASLDSFRGIAFVGGFSYADVLDSGKGWAGTIRWNKRLEQQFADFRQRPDTFSLGVCNGCQLMALLGWVPGAEEAQAGSSGRLPDLAQPRFVHNTSGRFESRWATVTVLPGSPAVLLKGMEGASMGIWCAHGEGRAVFPDASVQQRIMSEGLAPIRYCDAHQQPTEQYPLNPNGSPAGIAALCSSDGRHLAIMPHPERCFLGWQLPWSPSDARIAADGPSPWLHLFQNALTWCQATAS
ncbi:hypothetical protein WJX74_007244 [Apatococcus lobatus]|uniref:phosphoribosylformylglycinamidine synthase n=2 Tax=Apatococcus TaxID=904362 RepID=A0AAW1SLZ9_9CHLO